MAKSKITSSSTAEYFAKNLQQVGFSSPVKAVLTTLKEAVDNSLDACEDESIAPELFVSIKKVGKGSQRNTDLIEVIIEDNGPGLEADMLPKVFGEYLASSKFGRGQCSRGQQGIGISAATTWAQLTNAAGVRVMSKTKRMRKAVAGLVDVDIKSNKGVFRDKKSVDWDKEHGLRVEFKIDGRVQLNGDGGLITYLEGTTLVNPHLSLKYVLLDNKPVEIERVSNDIPRVPPPTLPHPHTMKLGEFITHAGLYGRIPLTNFLKKGFSRVTDNTIKELVSNGMQKKYLKETLNKLNEQDYKSVFQVIQKTPLSNPSTRSVLTVGEEALSKSIRRLGEVDFFSVVTRKPRICDFKPVVVEVALARFVDRGNADSPIQLLRFANRVPLQFDKGNCAITKAIESVNWRSYGLVQQKSSVPVGPYIFAVAVTSPFIKFKNASKETIDASDELVEEIRLACMRAGQKLSRHIRKEAKEADLERKLAHIESFGPILVDGLVKLTKASQARKKKAEDGLAKLLGRDSKAAEKDLKEADKKLADLKAKQKAKGITHDKAAEESGEEVEVEAEASGSKKKSKTTRKSASKKTTSKVAKKKTTKKAAAKKTTSKVAKRKTTKKSAAKKTTKKAAAKKKTTKKTAKKKTKKRR